MLLPDESGGRSGGLEFSSPPVIVNILNELRNIGTTYADPAQRIRSMKRWVGTVLIAGNKQARQELNPAGHTKVVTSG